MKCLTIKVRWVKVTKNTCTIMNVVGNIEIQISNSN